MVLVDVVLKKKTSVLMLRIPDSYDAKIGKSACNSAFGLIYWLNYRPKGPEVAEFSIIMIR